MLNESDPQSILQLNSPITLTNVIQDVANLTACDVIGDIHGCYEELVDLLRLLGHSDLLRRDLPIASPDAPPLLLFVGDIVDRGDRIMDSLRLVHDLCTKGYARMVFGNHDYRFFRWLQGDDVKIAHGLEQTIAEFNQMPSEQREVWRTQLLTFFESLPYAIRFDSGRGIVVHAAWRPRMKEEIDLRRVRYYAIYGPTTGDLTPQGFPERVDWASTYKGPEFAIFGHQVYLRPYNTPYAVGIDTGCVFGGGLTALRYPSRELVSVKSRSARAAYNGPMLDPNGD
ncbi:MAG: metallophosphoesterase [Ignavibacteriae bacterium]|nr:metallophosphoesterase [Ignavibacteriota bacterium]MCB9215652.1 metallophosphoesterase [Ignavibacteria bacterium]